MQVIILTHVNPDFPVAKKLILWPVINVHMYSHSTSTLILCLKTFVYTEMYES